METTDAQPVRGCDAGVLCMADASCRSVEVRILRCHRSASRNLQVGRVLPEIRRNVCDWDLGQQHFRTSQEQENPKSSALGDAQSGSGVK